MGGGGGSAGALLAGADLSRQRAAWAAAAALGLVGAGAALYQVAKVLFSVIRESEAEAGRLIHAVTAAITSESDDFQIPEDFELVDDIEEIWAGGSQLQELYFRRSVGGESDWQWSYDQEDWYPTSDLTPDHSFILDPPSLIYLSRLHLLSVARRHAASGGGEDEGGGSGRGRGGTQKRAAPRIPPPVALPEWAAQQQEQQLAAAGGSGQSDGCGGGGEASGSGGSGGGGGGGGRRLEDAPELLCCPISGQIMLQPVTLPSGKTFEYSVVRRWVAAHGKDPTTLQPLSLGEVHPNLAVRELVERWLAGANPLEDGGGGGGAQGGGGSSSGGGGGSNAGGQQTP